MTDEILVSICCLTYNHVNYISKALDGFLMQKTSFRYEILIHDDASTDGTSDIIRKYASEYPDIIKPIIQSENKYSKGIKVSHTYQFPRAKGKYIALCEGDDYWIDQYKLQSQVKFLELNLDYGLTYTKAKVYLEKEQSMSSSIGSECSGFNDLLKGNKIPTSTVLFRRDILFKYLNEIKPENYNWKMGDYPIWLYFSAHSKIQFIDTFTSVYRVLEASASHFKQIENTISFINNTAEIRYFFSNRYNCLTYYDVELLRVFEIYEEILRGDEFSYLDLIIDEMKDLYNKTHSKKLYWYIQFSSYPRLFRIMLKYYQKMRLMLRLF